MHVCCINPKSKVLMVIQLGVARLAWPSVHFSIETKGTWYPVVSMDQSPADGWVGYITHYCMQYDTHIQQAGVGIIHGLTYNTAKISHTLNNPAAEKWQKTQRIQICCRHQLKCLMLLV